MITFSTTIHGKGLLGDGQIWDLKVVEEGMGCFVTGWRSIICAAVHMTYVCYREVFIFLLNCYSYLTFFNLPRPATAATATTTATASRLRSQKLHIVLWGLHVGLVL